MNQMLRATALAAATICATAGASAQVLNSIDFTPINGTSWADPTNSPVQLNFGSLGTGEVTFTSVNGGTGNVTRSDYGDLDAKFGPTTLNSGAVFAPSTEVLFLIDPSNNPGPSGFTMTVTLDSGTFTPGSVFSPRSLDSAFGGQLIQSFLPGTGLGLPDSMQLPTDGNNIPDLALNPVTGTYAASVDGRSKGLAFEITGANSFSATFLSSPGYQPGGVAFTLAIPAVPEPSSYALMFAGLGVVGFLARRRNAAR